MIVKMWVNDSENGWVNDPENLPPQVVDSSRKITFLERVRSYDPDRSGVGIPFASRGRSCSRENTMSSAVTRRPSLSLTVRTGRK